MNWYQLSSNIVDTTKHKTKQIIKSRSKPSQVLQKVPLFHGRNVNVKVALRKQEGEKGH